MSLNDSLVAYWKLDETSGTRNDSVGSNHLTDNNTVTSAAGKISNAASFDSANLEYLSIADNADVRVGGIDFSMSFWMNPGSLDVFRAILGKRSGAGQDWNLQIYPDDDAVHFEVGGASLLTSGTTLTASTWYHTIIYRDSVNNNYCIVINDGTPSTANNATEITDSAAPFEIGRTLATNYYSGLIDEVGLWKRVLSASEITQLYNGGAGLEFPFPAGLPTGFKPNSLRPRIFAPGTSR